MLGVVERGAMKPWVGLQSAGVRKHQGDRSDGDRQQQHADEDRGRASGAVRIGTGLQFGIDQGFSVRVGHDDTRSLRLVCLHEYPTSTMPKRLQKSYKAFPRSEKDAQNQGNYALRRGRQAVIFPAPNGSPPVSGIADRRMVKSWGAKPAAASKCPLAASSSPVRRACRAMR